MAAFQLEAGIIPLCRHGRPRSMRGRVGGVPTAAEKQSYRQDCVETRLPVFALVALVAWERPLKLRFQEADIRHRVLATPSSPLGLR